MKSILIAGGAGYIGSHIARLLSYQGYSIVILDSYLHNQSFNPDWATIYRADYGDEHVLHTIFTQHSIDTIIHCAALIEVGHSVTNPASFYEVNVAKGITLLKTMLQHGVKKIIFSSSAAVYGNPREVPIPESHPCNPINPYGRTKWIFEQILHDFESAYGLKHVILRYFNVAGAWPEEGLGEQHQPETHLIPLLLEAAIQKRPFTVFGTDYPTKDGTALRDYVHVRDVAHAHQLALRHLNAQLPSDTFNIASSKGEASIREVINKIEEICQIPLTINYGPRRRGDPAILVADCSKAAAILQWKLRYSELPFIVASAWEFGKKEREKSEKIKKGSTYSELGQ